MRPTPILLALTLLLAVAGCETMEGAGRDMSAAGQTVTAEAKKASY
jgi:predicted small secreted protein